MFGLIKKSQEIEKLEYLLEQIAKQQKDLKKVSISNVSSCYRYRSVLIDIFNEQQVYEDFVS